MRSDGYSTGDIKYEFINGKKGVTQDSFEMPQFGLMDLGVKSKKVTLSSGTYSRLGILFLFKRSIGFYIIQVYLPAALIVIISYVSFWVPRNSVPARISLGVTTVLTITTLTVTTSASNVKISYVKALDCYLGFCFLMVFSSLIEYAIVGYIGKRHSSDEKEKAIKEAVAAASSYVRLIIRLRLTRQLGFYLMNIIIPSILIVMISWISFWLSRSASPARVSIGVTTVLTLVTLISTTNSQLPKVSYVKSLDIFLNFSFVMVFISLVEFSVVSYMAKKLEQRRDKKRRLQEQIQNAEIPMFGTYPHNKMIASPELPSDCDCKTIPLIQAPRWCNDPSVNDSKKGCGSVHKIDSGITLSNFEIVNACVNKSTAVTSTGSYDRLFVLFRFRRQPGFYMIQSLIPAAVLVMLSFISFYISKNSAPSRTSFVMAFLALTHLFCGTNRKIHVAYLKASDVYLMTCLLIVASVLAEYAIVSFTSRVYEGRLKRKNEKNPIGLRPSAPDPLHGKNNH
uniref:Neur_chan_memb domain-containing protein n=1 Tax=Rhabditophanes sp. KR3021 TaxID=114890 RepID=A0AC35TNE5_9BILA